MICLGQAEMKCVMQPCSDCKLKIEINIFKFVVMLLADTGILCPPLTARAQHTYSQDERCRHSRLGLPDGIITILYFALWTDEMVRLIKRRLIVQTFR
jgi:hypothetical protein